MEIDRYYVAKAMQTYGGNFVKILGELILAADPSNLEKIKSAFPEYWEKYENIVKYNHGPTTYSGPDINQLKKGE